MKTNTTKKVIVATMAIAMGASIVGSISGTAAWYQYSTRATAELSGVAGGVTEDLLISDNANNGFGSVLTIQNEFTLKPITSEALALDKAPTKFYKNPMYQSTKPSTWGEATSADYYEFTVYAKVRQNDGGNNPTYFANKNIYLTDVTFQAITGDGKYDVTEALRVAVYDAAGAGFATYSQTDYSATGMNVYGPLDLGGPVGNDTAKKYTWQNGTFPELVYGEETVDEKPVAKTYGGHEKAADDTTHKIADDSDPTDIKGKALAITTSTTDAVKVCTIRIYLEGWAKLGEENAKSSIWDITKTVGAKFHVGLQFGTSALDIDDSQQQPSTNP